MTDLIPIPAEMTEQEGQSLLSDLQDRAANHIHRSSEELTLGIICLNTIREHALFTFGGYDSWEPYLEDFKTQNGFSRSLTYDNLKIARLTMGGMGLSTEDVLDYRIDRLKPFAKLVAKYNRATGEITALVGGVADKLVDYAGDTVGEQLGTYIKEKVNPEKDTVGTILALMDKELPHKAKYRYGKVKNSRGVPVDIHWEAMYPDGTDNAGHCMADMTQDVEADFNRRLGIKED